MKYSLKQIIGILASAERQGMPEDNPEGSRYVQLSDTLVSAMTADLQEHATEHEALAAKLEASKQAALAASRQAITDKALAQEEWQSGDDEIDAEFRAEALAAATAAADDEAAEAAVNKLVGRQQKLLGLAKNTPGIKTGDPLGQGKLSEEQQKAIEAARREMGLN